MSHTLFLIHAWTSCILLVAFLDQFWYEHQFSKEWLGERVEMLAPHGLPLLGISFILLCIVFPHMKTTSLGEGRKVGMCNIICEVQSGSTSTTLYLASVSELASDEISAVWRSYFRGIDSCLMVGIPDHWGNVENIEWAQASTKWLSWQLDPVTRSSSCDVWALPADREVTSPGLFWGTFWSTDGRKPWLGFSFAENMWASDNTSMGTMLEVAVLQSLTLVPNSVW